MRMEEKIKKIVLSWDFILAIIVTLLTGLYFKKYVMSYEVAREIFGMSITVLSIVFSIFFASLAVLVSSGDNAFIRFLEEEGAYSSIIWTFKFSLILIFIALMFSILLFITVLPFEKYNASGNYPGWIMTIFAFLGSYGLFSVVNAAMDAVTYSEFRIRFTQIMMDEHDEKSTTVEYPARKTSENVECPNGPPSNNP